MPSSIHSSYLYRGSRSQAGVPQSLQFFCHLRGQGLQVAPSVLLITHPTANKQTYIYITVQAKAR